MRRLSGFGWFCLVLMMIGGINWGIIGFFNYNVIGQIFQAAPGIVRLIYAIVGLATLWVIGETLFKTSERRERAERGRVGRPHPA